MNPYGIERTSIRPADLTAWNDGIERARDEYAAHPITFGEGDDTCNRCRQPRVRGRTLCTHHYSEHRADRYRIKDSR